MTLAGAVLAGVERSLVPLDVVRRGLYRALVPWLGPWIRDRRVRVGVHGVTVALAALAGAVLAPLWLLALGPLLLGVPHLVADLRYLVVRPGLHRRRFAWLIGLLVLASSAMVDLRWGLFGAALVPLLARGAPLRRLAVFVPLAGLAAASWWASGTTGIVLAHAHNLIAVCLWMMLAVALHGGGGVGRWAPTVAFAAGGALILTGTLDSWVQLGFTLPGAPTEGYHAASLAPGLDAVWTRRWIVAFAYAQAVHYGLWLRMIPEEGRRRPSPRSWGASLVALRSDFGDRFLAAAILLVLGIGLWGVADLVAARAGYLRLALFHGPLEIAVLAWVAVEGRTVLRP